MTDSRTPPPPAHPGLTGRTKALALAAVVTASAAAGYGWWATTARPPAASAAHPTPALEAHIGQDGSVVLTRLLVDEGALVRQGQALARIQSQEVLSAEAELARARTEAATARLQAQRDAALLAEGIIAAARHA